MRNRTGFSLIELMVSVAIGSVVIAALSAILVQSAKTQTGSLEMIQLATVRKDIMNAITLENASDPKYNAWTNTLAATENQTPMKCLIQGTACTPTTPVAFSLYDSNNKNVFDATVASNGFTPTGQKCNKFSMQGNDDCPFRYDLKWSAACVGATCISPQILVSANLIYKPAKKYIEVNPALYSISGLYRFPQVIPAGQIVQTPWPFIQGIAYGDGKFVIGGSTLMPMPSKALVMVSVSGGSFQTASNNLAFGGFPNLQFGSNKFWTFSGFSIETSTNAQSWSGVTLSSMPAGYIIGISNLGKDYAYGCKPSSGQATCPPGEFENSGSGWTNIYGGGFSGNTGTIAIVGVSGKYAAINGNNLLYSTSITSGWHAVALPKVNGMPPWLTQLVYGNGKFVALEEFYASNTSCIYVSTNGSSWGTADPKFGGTWNRPAQIKFANGMFYAVGAAGEVSTSPDGSTWTAHTFTCPTGKCTVMYIDGDGNGNSVLATNDTDNSPNFSYVGHSVDSVHWSLVPPPTP